MLHNLYVCSCLPSNNNMPFFVLKNKNMEKMYIYSSLKYQSHDIIYPQLKQKLTYH